MSYIYWLSITSEDKELAYMEASFLLGQPVFERVVITTQLFNICHAAYIKIGGELLAKAGSFDELCLKIKDANYDFDRFKIEVHKSPLVKKEIGQRLGGVIRIADLFIHGHPDLKSPLVELDVFSDDNQWYFLKRLTASDNSWLAHINKPYNFSSSLNARHCRSLVNIASTFGRSLIDPCCGFGNLLVEANRIGLSFVGVEINSNHVFYAKENLAHFKIDPNHVIEQDILQYVPNGVFDCAVIDFPYNLNCKASDTFYVDTLRRLKEYVSNFVILTIEGVEPLLESLDLEVLQIANPYKNSFVRIVTVAKCK